jgi:imidazole glycerol phosphate synthase glutamine amidotransferase subunit
MPDVTIIDLGIANRASVANAFAHLGVDSAFTRDADEVRTAQRLILPGVGAFGAGMRRLADAALVPAIQETVARGTPTLGICLGFQLLCESSDETPGMPGLGVIPAQCRRLPQTVCVPHLGWNAVRAPGGGVMATGTAAFANSYAVLDAPDGWMASWTVHGTPFAAALERGSVLACQFHPELSGAWGRALLERWVHGTAASPAAGALGDGEGDGLRHRVIPCLDVRDGRVVKGVRFQGLRDAGDPAARAARYEAQGADEIVVLDVGASPEARATQVDTVRAVRRALSIPLTVGGGVRSVDDAAALLDAGADKVSVNTAAVQRPALLAEMAEAFGSQCVVLAVDARRKGDRWEVRLYGGREPAGVDAIAWGRDGTARGAGEILLTSWDRDGTRDGCDLELLRAMRRAVTVPVIASGGVGESQHVADAIAAGADAVLAASIFHDGDGEVGAVKRFLTARKIPVRT